MPQQTRIVLPGPDGQSVCTTEGQVLRAPTDWTLVPPGDPGLTRRIKAAGPTWTVQEKKGRKIFSRGVWAAAATVETVRAGLAAERDTPQYAKRKQADGERREKKQTAYVGTFREAVFAYLEFNERYRDLAESLADAVTAHATPVGSGTVARTERIPVEDRAEAAVIAWMRHQTTGYDTMVVPRVKGKRREIRRMLAGRSKMLLEGYRRGIAVDPLSCPLQRALKKVG